MIKNITDLKKADNFFLLAGPCVIEGEEMALRIAEHIVKVTDSLGIPYVFKGSYRKANRSRLDSFTGIGDVGKSASDIRYSCGDRHSCSSGG